MGDALLLAAPFDLPGLSFSFSPASRKDSADASSWYVSESGIFKET